MGVLARVVAALVLGLPLALAGCARGPDADSEMLTDIVESQRASMAALGRPMAPAGGGRPEGVATGGRLSGPATGARLNDPLGGGRINDPAAGGRMNDPAAGGRMNDPAAGGRMNEIAARPVPRGQAPAESAAFLGATPDILRRWLGEPRLMRLEGEAQVWLYQGANCHFDLVLYPDRGALRVAFAAARASGTERRTETACLAELSRPVARAGG